MKFRPGDRVKLKTEVLDVDHIPRHRYLGDQIGVVYMSTKYNGMNQYMYEVYREADANVRLSIPFFEAELEKVEE